MTENRTPQVEALFAAALRKVATRFEREWQDGQRSWAIDLGDLVAMVRAVADELSPPTAAPGCEFCRHPANRPDAALTCPYCGAAYPAADAGK